MTKYHHKTKSPRDHRPTLELVLYLKTFSRCETLDKEGRPVCPGCHSHNFKYSDIYSNTFKLGPQHYYLHSAL